MGNTIFDDYLIRPMESNLIIVYYPRVFPNGRKCYMPIGNFTFDKVKSCTLKELDAKIKSKCERVIEEYLAGLN